MHLGHQGCADTKERARIPVRLAFRTILGSSENCGALFARDRNRTCDLRVTSALLYQLSYTGGGLKLALQWAPGNLPNVRRNDSLDPEARLQMAFGNVDIVLAALGGAWQVAVHDKY